MVQDLNRRKLIGGAAALGVASTLSMPALAQAKVLKIGYVSPVTGQLAVFGETDKFIIGQLQEALAGGISVGGKTINVELVVRDSQSSPSRAASIAAELIEKDQVNIMLATATPDTTNPVSDQCELAGVPCATTAAPWEAWYFGRGANPKQGFDYTYHYFFGLAEAIKIYTSMWSKLDTNKKVGGLFPNDADGDAWGHPERGFPHHLPKLGFELINPGSFTNGTDNFSSHISAFKEAGVEIITGVLNPPDWNTFWKQAKQQGFQPKIATIAKALVFPAAVSTLGEEANGLTTEVVWSPVHPFSSSITGQSSQQLADAWTKSVNKLWTPPLGWTHSIFEVGVNALKTASDPHDRESVTAALAATNLETIMGPVNFSTGPFGKNVSVTPTVGGQWKTGGKYGIDLDIIDNSTLSAVPITAEMRSLKS